MTPLHPDRRFHRLAEIARTLAYAQSADQVTEVTLREADALLGSQSAALLIAGGDGAVEVHASPALRLRAQRKLHFNALDEEAIEHLRELLVTEGEPTFLAVPMVTGARVGGVLAMALPGGRDGDEDEWFLSAIADQAALSLEKLQLTRETEAANRARQRREEQFQGLYDSPLIALVFRRRDGRLADANPAFLALSGRASEELASLTWDDVAVRRRRAAQEGLYEYELLRADGQHLEVLVGTAPLPHQECDLAFVIDISRRKRAEISMRILSELSKALLGASLDYEALWRTLAWLVVPRFADWCAVEAVEEGASIGRNVALEHVSVCEAEGALEWRRRFPPDPKSRVGVAEVIRTARSQLHAHIGESFLSEYTCASDQESDLKRRGLRSALLAPMVLHGAVVGVITCVRTAARRRFDKDDLVLAEEMARQAASAVENARLYHRAQEAIGLRDEFLAVAAHELKTPLTTLLLQIEMLGRTIESADESTERRLHSAQRQVQRLTRLVSDVVNVSRMAAGELALQREVCDLAELVRETARDFEVEARASHTHVELDLPPEPVRGRWDRPRLEQVIANLLSNAIKYGAAQPVRVSLRADAMARLTVEDHGIGISSTDLSRIFGRFERAVSTHNYGGLGLGLFIVRQIIEAHGGTVHVDSRPGAGAVFTVELPGLVAAELSASPQP